MVTKASFSVSRFSRQVLPLLVGSVFLLPSMRAQLPSVVSSSAVAVPHNESYGNPWQTAVSNRGDFLLFDFKTGGFYQYPGNGGAEVTIGAPGNPIGGFTDSGIAVDPRNNNLYLDNNYNGGLLEYPYDAATGKWDLPSVTVASGLAGNLGGSCGNYFQSAGLAINDNGVLAVATENGCGVEIFTVPIDASGNFGSATPIVANMTARARTVSIDDAGNIAFTEDNGLTGAYYIPAGVTGLTVDTGVTRIDPNLGNVQGVATDRAGNLYIADGSKGIYLVPMSAGSPNPAQAVFIAPALAQGNAVLDQAHGVLFVPAATYGTYKDVVKLLLNRAEFGGVATGATSAAPQTITYAFTSAATPASFVVQQSSSTADFAVATGGSCVAATAQAAGSTCTVSVNFTAHTPGGSSASLFMLDAKGNVLATTLLHGLGQGASIVVAPGTESTIGAGLKTPSQIATDAAGNVYIADSGLGKVLEYPKGSGTTGTPISLGTGLKAPTGVAVDGTGNVYIADSGSIFEVPFGPTGLNAAGQTLVQSGFGTKLQLAASGLGSLFVADPDNQRVANLRPLLVGASEVDITGLTQLTTIASERGGAVFIANGQNLIQVSNYNVQKTLLTNLPIATGLAVDPSASIYVTSSNQTVRIPNQGGTLNQQAQTTIATGVKQPTSIAIDFAGNVFVADGSAKSVDYINPNGSLNFGTLATTTSTATGAVTLSNSGNTALTVTGFTSTPDYSETATTCVGMAIAVGANCSATITFNPGPGDQGTLTGQILTQGNPANVPIGINLTGVGATLAASTTTIAVNTPTVTSTAVVVKVAGTATGAAPTGSVTVTATSTTNPTVVLTQALTNGTATFNETALSAGAYTFTANYTGDRAYGVSSATTKITITAGAVTLTQPAQSTVPTYVLSSGIGSYAIYDGSAMSYVYKYVVKITAANGSPLLGTPILNSMGAVTGYDYGIVSFYDATATLACQPINVNADGTAPFTANCVNINTSNTQIVNIQTSYTLTPVYTGNTNPSYAKVTGVPFSFTAVRDPAVIIAANPGTLAVSVGSTASASLTLTSLLGYGTADALSNLNNYALPVELACDGLPAHATCSFTYPVPDPSDANSTDVTPTTPGQARMTVNTNVAVGTVTAGVRSSNGATFAAVFGLSLLGLAMSRRRLRLAAVAPMLAMLMLLSASVVGMSSCSTANIASSPVLTTPKGTYTVIVTAKQTGSVVIPTSTPGVTQTIYGTGNQVSIPFTMTVTVQ